MRELGGSGGDPRAFAVASSPALSAAVAGLDLTKYVSTAACDRYTSAISRDASA